MDISQVAHPGGVANYTLNLSKYLLEDKELEMVFFYSSLRKPYKGKLKNVKSFRLPPTLFEVLFNKVRNVSIERFIGPLDIFHSSDWAQPTAKAKKVTTYHDLTPLKYPQWSHPKIVTVNKARLKLVEAEVDMVIAVSESTKKDLMEVSNIPENKITVIYEGVNEIYKPQAKKDVESFRQKMNLPDNFILSIGGVGERRNLKAVKEATKGYKLVITGQTIPWLKDEDLPLLYAAADVLLYPSFYEGFGLPILEAMAVGTPVITSNVSAMPEVGGEAALYVNPESIEDIKQKLEKVLKDENIRKQMIQKGFSQAKKFSWQKCAKETAEIYKQLMQN